MANNKIRLGIEDIIWIFALFMCGIYFLEDMADRTMLVIFALLTLIPIILSTIPLFQTIKKKKWFSTMCLNLKYSSSFFIFGMFFTRILVKKELLQFPGSVVFFSIMIYAIVIIGSFGYYFLTYFYNMDKTIEDNTKALKRSNIKGFDELLQTIETKDANVLAVAGNLLSIKTKIGIGLLKKFLDKNTSNSLKLIIPEESQQYLTTIKQEIDKSLLIQIEVLVYKPFWFLQGVVIIGKKEPEYKHAITPVGCYYYKTKFSEEEDMAEDGIFIDLSKKDIYDNYSQAVSAYYFLMNTLKYSKSPYEVEEVFKKDFEPYNPNVSIVDWSEVK
jgi:hypothetical protein